MSLSRLQRQMASTPPTGQLAWDEPSALAEIIGASSSLPYGADNYVVTYYGSTNNIETVVFKLGSTTLKTRTFTYVASGVADNDKLASVADA